MTHYVDVVHGPSHTGVFLPAKDSIDRWSSLSNLSRFLLESNTFHDYMERTVHSVVEILNLDFSRVLLLEPNGHYYCRMAYYKDLKIVQHQMDTPEPLIAEHVYQKVASLQQALVPYYLGDSFSPEECMACSGIPFGSVWLVQLLANSQNLGFLVLGKTDSTMVYQYLIESTHLVDLIAGQLSNAILRVKLNDRLNSTTLEIVQALTKALEVRDIQSSLHSQQMASLSTQLANQLGCSEKESLDIYWAALLHDIGKIGVEDSILRKPG
ncbi:MAG TPA: HD domain-containing protein, partial [Leptolinea sp.]